MRHTILLLALLCTALHSRAQRVTNVTAEQQGQELLIHYHLEADGPVEVLLYLSTDRGSRWEGPLKSCSGDVGPNVAPGSGKRIRWEVLKDRELVGDGIAFKVVAKGQGKATIFNSYLNYGLVIDIDGNRYKTIRIGEQEWMAENLRVIRYDNGIPIQNVSDQKKWQTLNEGAFCSYNNDENNDNIYGKFYNWYAVNSKNNICPIGWHVPSDEEWNELARYLGGGSSAGGRMKSLFSWIYRSSGASNASGFSGLPSGNRSSNGFSYNMLEKAYWWTATSSGDVEGWGRELIRDSDALIRRSFNARNGFCIRCIRD
jgi:uncharacterized protein (TIGR02145 family)